MRMRGKPSFRPAIVGAGGMALLALCVMGARPASSPQEDVERMLGRVLRAPEVLSEVLITRSDPFGGPPERTSGRLWFLPGRGLRFHTDEGGGQDIVLDREREVFLVYRRKEKVLYKGPWDRAPARLRQLVAQPERVLEKDLKASPEARVVGRSSRAGYRLRRAALGDSLPAVSVWIAANPSSGLPRWLSVTTAEDDSVLVELKGLAVLRSANAKHLEILLPRTLRYRTEPFDPRELLRGGESR